MINYPTLLYIIKKAITRHHFSSAEVNDLWIKTSRISADLF